MDTSPRPALSPTRRFVVLGGVAVLAAGAMGWRYVNPTYAGQALSVADAHSQAVAGEITLVDIRRPDEWESTGIGEGANPLDMRRDDFTDALLALVGGQTDQPIALICARGVRSARTAKRLSDAGFTNIIDVPEGMLGSGAGPGWLASDLPVRRQ